jgi:hypothetical protein
MIEPAPPYTVKMMGATSLNFEERGAAEFRFRMALEFGVGGPEYVVPTLQACMLARALMQSLAPEDATDAECAAEREVIAMWENAEDQAIMTALKPLNTAGDMNEVQFEIST